ncbi:hypothetical protein Y032_0143g2405 [Ancylostoma ceylanicum]|nr:hypothetical protein Y032_0143g2405 [Ancylostoma ceylanicum]
MAAMGGKATPNLGFETEVLLLEKRVRAAIGLLCYLRKIRTKTVFYTQGSHPTSHTRRRHPTASISHHT